MRSAPAERRGWPARRWWTAIAVVFALQLAALFSLEDRTQPVPRKAEAPEFRLAAENANELFAVEDPTLFALPHRHGFSGPVWLDVPPQPYQPKEWPPPDLFLPVEFQNWGALFKSFVASNPPPAFANVPVLRPDLTVPQTLSVAPPIAPSRLLLTGDLASRRLLSPPPLPSWTNDDLLTNSIVQVVVDGRGRPVSAALLISLQRTEKQKEADAAALALARTARFEPLKSDHPGQPQTRAAELSMGTMIFAWQTIPAPSTNTPLPAL